jgi:histidine triad (HIT) family protein
MNCIFCKIGKKEAEAEVLFEDDRVISFLDINPLNYGHTLVIPKKHYENFASLEESELKHLTAVTQKLSKAVVDSLKAEGFNIIVNNGKAAGQTVFHFHYHIIPRFESDKFIFHRNMKKYGENDPISYYGDKIRQAVINKG